MKSPRMEPTRTSCQWSARVSTVTTRLLADSRLLSMVRLTATMMAPSKGIRANHARV